MSAERSRPIALGLILGAHIVLIYIIERSVIAPGSTSASDDTPPITINFIITQPELIRQSAAPQLTPNPPSSSPVAPVAIPPDIPPISTDSAPTITDWSFDAHTAATDTLERERRGSPRRPFTHTPSAPDPPGKLGVFGAEQQNHRAGQVEGGTRFWVNDNCYFDVPTGSAPPRMAGEFHLLTRVCKPPPTGGGDRMFEDLKPDALKKLPSH